jgi:acyl CoA:acetate/3-ketoacid CoA transferase alpha subunit
MNNNTADKVVSMREAVAQYVSDGSSVAIEGFTGFICFAPAMKSFGNGAVISP